MAEISAHGLALDLPAGWEGEIYVREPEAGAATATTGFEVAQSLAAEVRLPVLHAANFALPPDRGDFGGGAVERMGARNLFVSLFEHGGESLDTPLFAAVGRPRLAADDFSPQQMQRSIAGQSGRQLFFQENGRPFCLYVALGSHRLRALLAGAANDLLQAIVID